MLRDVMVALLLLLGLSHAIGFIVPWRIVRLESYPPSTTLLFGRYDAGEGGARSVGMLWLLPMVGFVAAAFALLGGQESWTQLALTSSGMSAILAVLGLARTWPWLAADALVASLVAFVPAVHDLVR